MTNYNNLRKFVSPEIIFGAGSRNLAGQYAKQFLANKVLIVTDPGVIRAGWLADIEKSLKEVSIPYIVFSNISPNPRATEIMEGADLFMEHDCDVIVSIGGGSPMDCAKGIGMVTSNNKHILEFEGVDRIENPVPPLILIPTTAGTSADVSQFCIVLNSNQLKKIAIVSKAIVPDVALIDSETTMTMDRSLTAFTGMDALVHAIEAYVSKGGGPITDSYAIEAIDLIFTNLPKLIKDENNIVLREKIMLGSMKAGLAFSNASLGAVHAMAHSLGGFLDLPHGECNSMLLEHVINFNFNKIPDKFKIIAERMNIDSRGMDNKMIKKSILDTVYNFKRSIGVEHQLSDKGVKIADIHDLSKKALGDACMLTNPRDANIRDIEVIFEEAL